MLHQYLNRPDQDLSIIQDYLTDKLTGYNSPKLHLVAFDSSPKMCSDFSEMAQALKGHFHGYNTFTSKSSEPSCEHKV